MHVRNRVIPRAEHIRPSVAHDCAVHDPTMFFLFTSSFHGLSPQVLDSSTYGPDVRLQAALWEKVSRQAGEQER